MKLYYYSTSLNKIKIPSGAFLLIVGCLVQSGRRIAFPQGYFAYQWNLYRFFQVSGFTNSSSGENYCLLKKSFFFKKYSISEVEYHFPHFNLFPNKIEDQLNKFSLKLNERNHLFHCHLERTPNIFSLTLGKLYPSEILALALGRLSLAISAADVITQLSGQQINATVFPTLAFDSKTKFSLLSLIEYGCT